MSLIIETNSFNLEAIPSDKIVLIVNKGAMLRDVRAKSSNKKTKSYDKEAMTGDKETMSVGKANNIIDFEVFDNLGIL